MPPLSRPQVVALLAAALLARLFFVFVGPFFIRPDEVFQALEPAHRLLTGHGAVTWEWHAGIRSWLLPGAIAAIMRASAATGLGHSVLAVQCVFATLSLAVVLASLRFGQAVAGGRGALLCGALAAFWPETVLDGAHTLTETQGGNVLAVATLLAAVALRRPFVGRRDAIAIGALLGLAVVLRFPLLPGAAVVGAAFLPSAPGRRAAAPLLLAGAAVLAAAAVLDAATLGSPLQSIWKNLAINIGAHRAVLYGTASPFFYLGAAVEHWGAALLPLAVLFAAGLRRAPLPALVAAAVIGSHSAVAHKEWSFVAGAVPLVLAVAGVGAATLLERAAAPPAPRHLVAAIALLSVLTVFSGDKGLRRDHAEDATLMREARRLPALCGLALDTGAADWWDWTGGASLLDRPVPIFLLRSPADLAAAGAGADAMLARADLLPTIPAPWGVVRCLRELCLLRRPPPCAAPDRALLLENAPDLGLPDALAHPAHPA